MPATHQRPLQPDGLVEGQTFSGTLAVGVTFGQVDGAQRLVFGDQIVLGAQFFWERIGHQLRSNAACTTSPLTAREASAMLRSDALPWFRPSAESRMRNAGCVNCIAPRKNPTSPDSITLVPLVRPFFR